MAEADVAEKLAAKRAELEAKGGKDSILEAEIKTLEASLAEQKPSPRRRRSAFLDECAG
jgi:hypothetical protein